MRQALDLLMALALLAAGCTAPANSPGPVGGFAPTGGLPDAAAEVAGAETAGTADASANADSAAETAADAADTPGSADIPADTVADTDTADTDGGSDTTDAPDTTDASDTSDGADTTDAKDSTDTTGTSDAADISDAADGADSGDAVGSKDAAAPPPVGPGLAQLGAACPGWEGEPTCSNDKKWRLECVNGAWTPQQHCGFGLCAVVQAAGGAAVTTCGVPPVSDPALSQACARLLGCFDPGLSHQACVRRASEPAAVAGELGVGRKLTVAEAAVLELGSVANCAASAANCADLAQCFQFFLAPKCGSTANSGCDGDIAWTCSGQKAPLAVNCKGLGMQCFHTGSSVSCVNPAPCPAGAQPSSCTGQTALQCVAGSDGKVVGLTTNCLETAGTCKANVAAPANPCSGPAVPCQPDAALAQCLPGSPAVLMICSPGSQVKKTCASKTNCLVQDQFGQLGPSCPAGQLCTQGECGSGGPCSQPSKCDNGSVWFCEKGWPASFDCKALGKSCVVAASGPRCQ